MGVDLKDPLGWFDVPTTFITAFWHLKLMLASAQLSSRAHGALAAGWGGREDEKGITHAGQVTFSVYICS